MAEHDLHDGYDVLGRIGEGGAGVVYRVRERGTGSVLAMKVMPRSAGAQNLRGEFLALRRLRHPNIVAVHDVGLTRAGDDFFTMDLVEGPSLARAAGEVGSRAFFELFGGAVAALAFIHGRGVVHADIKPSNILVDGRALADHPEKAARLVDFGLSAALADPQASKARGTFPYAAPEVYTGELDARSDLYAMGVVLYELLTGASPFAGDDVTTVLATQRAGGPPDPREMCPELPAALAELVVGLLEPTPSARPQSADEVLARINEFGGTGFEESGAAPLIAMGGTLIGRDAELGQLLGLWDAACEGRGGAAVLRGEEGIGKSRLLAELKLTIQLRGAAVHSTGAAASARAPLAGLAQLARSLLASTGGLDSAAAAGFRRALAPLIGGEVGPSQIDRESRYALAEALASTALEAASHAPLALVVDAAEAADEETCEILAYLARAAAGAPLLVAIGVRDGAPGKAHVSRSLAALCAAIDQADHGRVIALGPLGRGSVYGLAAAALGAELAEAIAIELHRATGGNPGYAARALADLVERRAVARERGRWRLHEDPVVIPPPAGALESAKRRVRGLDGRTRHTLEAASAAGSTFSHAEVIAMVTPDLGGGAEGAIDEALAEAAALHLIEVDANAGQLRFTHPELAEALYSDVPTARKARYHRRGAAHLSRASARGDVVPAASLASHYLALGDVDRAAHWGRLAAEKRARAYDPHGAIDAYRRVLPLLEEDSSLAPDVHERMADLLAAVGEAEVARQHYAIAADSPARPPHKRIRSLCRSAEVERQLGAGDAAYERLMRALSEVRAAGLDEEEAWVHHAIGRVLMYRAQYRQALEHATAGHVLAAKAARRDLSALLQGLRADVEIYRGNARAALDHLDRAMVDAEVLGDEALAGQMLLRLGRAAIHTGDYGRAVNALERAIPASRRAGRVHLVARAFNNLGIACHFLGDWERARRSLEQFRDLCVRLDERSELVNALNNLGMVYRDEGALRDAEAAFDRAAALAEATGHAHMAAMILGNRGEVKFRQGDLGEANACYEAALEEFERIGAREEIVENQRRLSEVDLAAGRPEKALDRAIDAAREAKRIGARFEEAILLRIAAQALRVRGDLESAAWFGERAREIVTSLGVRHERARLDAEAAELAFARGEPSEASVLFSAAMETFASLGARWDLARTRARYKELEPPRSDSEKRGGLELLLELGRAAAHQELDVLLELALDRLLATSGFDRGFILLLDDEGRPRERMRRTRPGSPSFAPDDAAFSGSVVRRVASSGEAVSFTDIADEDDLRHQRSVVALGLRRVMCAPMRSHGRTVAVLYIDSVRASVAEPEVDLPIFEAFAAQLALAVDNARLRGEERRKTEIVGMLAHEIRNPLGGILGHAELGAKREGARNDTDDGSQTAGSVFRRIQRDAERLARLVENMLELARHEAGNVDWSMTGFDAGALIVNVVEGFRPQCAARDIGVAVETNDENVRALGNPDRITQVVSNLLSNAIKFSPEGGQIRVYAGRESVAREDPDSPPAPATELSAWSPLDPGDEGHRDYLRVDVADSGPGLSEELRARLFEKFVQGGRSSGGIGLGLYISREIIERHGGSIWASSEPGRGATFSFRIPLRD